ncbi:MAG: thymidylate synthase [Methanobacteriaceae archaeon]|nr:MAG: thymidylate synthase [Methanobacterium sp. BRmetb2]MCC7557275.1 thymidylate synthase [Methanobacteriaceae archaeon]
MSFQIEVNEIADGWETLVRKIMKEGKEIKDERGSLTKEILNTVVTIINPLGNKMSEDFYLNKIAKVQEIRIPEGYFWSGEKLELYSEQFLSKDRQGFVYTYGNRLRKHFNDIDQIQVAIDRLKNCEESRRAISVTWDPTVDTKTEEVPCMILVDLKIRNGKLYTTALWRSHDIYGAWFPNAVGLTHLAKYVAEKLDVEVATVTIHSISAHIYEVNFKDTEKILEL